MVGRLCEKFWKSKFFTQPNGGCWLGIRINGTKSALFFFDTLSCKLRWWVIHKCLKSSSKSNKKWENSNKCTVGKKSQKSPLLKYFFVPQSQRKIWICVFKVTTSHLKNGLFNAVWPRVLITNCWDFCQQQLEHC